MKSRVYFLTVSLNIPKFLAHYLTFTNIYSYMYPPMRTKRHTNA